MSPVLWVVVIFFIWLFLAVVYRSELLDNFYDLLNTLLTDITNGLKEAIQWLIKIATLAVAQANHVWNVLTLGPSTATSNPGHSPPGWDVITRYAKNVSDRPELIFGSLVYLVALLLFAYADAAQGAHSLKALLGTAVSVPAPFENLLFPLLVASVGTVFVNALILAELFGATHLAPYADQPPPLKRVARALAILAVVMAIVFSLFIGFARLPIIAEAGSGTLVFGYTKEQWTDLAALGQNLIIVPLLLTTVLLLWGVFGGYVLLIAMAAVLFLALALTFWFLSMILSVLEWFFRVIQSAIKPLIDLLKAILEAVLLRRLWGFFTRP